MKYSPTVRLINVVLFALLGFGFGYLGVYFGILVGPNLWLENLPFGMKVPEMSLALVMLLGALGLAGLLLSVLGLVKSILSLVRRDDERVRQAFGCYIGIGYLIAVFFLLNAVWLYRLLTTNIGFNEIGFAIVIYVILMIVALVASSIPLVKMFGEGEGTNRVMGILTRSVIAASLAVAVPFFIAFLRIASNQELVSHPDIMMTKFGLYALVPFVAAVIGCVALFGYGRAEKAGTYKKLNGLLFESALLVLGAAIIVAGVLNYVYKDGPYSLIASVVKSQVSSDIYTEFTVCSSIVGGLIAILSLVLMYFTVFPPKLKSQQN